MRLSTLSVLLLLACAGQDAVTAPTQVTPAPEVAAPAPEESGSTRYVVASRLNLRVEPGGEKVGRLKINSPVEILEQDGENAKIRVQNGKTGWVPVKFLVGAPVSITSALQSAVASETAEERLSWTQRAAALDFRHRGALQALAAAYRETGDEQTALKIDSQLDWPDDILLAGAHNQPGGEGTVVEWGIVPWEQFESLVHEERVLTEAQMKRLGVAKGDPVWVLPSTGPAVRGAAKSMRLQNFNECGGTWGYTLTVDVHLDPGVHAVAFTIEEPPKAWLKGGPGRDLDGAVAMVKKKLGGGESHEIHAAAFGDGVRVRAGIEKIDDDMPEWTLTDFQIHPDGRVEQVNHITEYHSYIGFDYPSVGRDVNGDGRLDLIMEGLCEMSLIDADGVSRAMTAGLCCGC